MGGVSLAIPGTTRHEIRELLPMRVLVITALALMLSAAISEAVAESGETRAFPAMGTRVVIEARGPQPAALDAMLDRQRRLFEHRHREWYPWRSDSALARINRELAVQGQTSVSDELLAVLRQARYLERQSRGRFNAAIGGLIRLWGFDRPPPYRSPQPRPRELLYWLAVEPSLTDLQFGDNALRSSNPAVHIDLGGIGKGATVEDAIESLEQDGATAALVNAGGDVAGYGRNDGDPWRIGIRDPRGGVLAALPLQGREAVFTSGDYERYREGESGKRLGHVLDPRTGRPARGAVQATVVSDDAARADAAATALLVAGRAGWREAARDLGLAKVMIVDRRGTVRLTRALADRLELRVGADREVVIRQLNETPTSNAAD